MKLMKNNKQVGGLQTFILGIVSVAVVLAVGLIVLSELMSTQVTNAAACGTNLTGGIGGDILYTNCGAAYNATSDIVTKLSTVPTWIGIIIVVALAFIVLGYFYLKK
jgi:hypothetical protein